MDGVWIQVVAATATLWTSVTQAGAAMALGAFVGLGRDMRASREAIGAHALLASLSLIATLLLAPMHWTSRLTTAVAAPASLLVAWGVRLIRARSSHAALFGLWSAAGATWVGAAVATGDLRAVAFVMLALTLSAMFLPTADSGQGPAAVEKQKTSSS